MKCVTVCEPFASAIVFGGKDVENRHGLIGLRGPTIIQAGKSLKWYEPELTAWLHERWPECPENPVAAMAKFSPRHGLAIGVAYFGDPFRINQDGPRGLPIRDGGRFATGPVCYPVLCVEPLWKPFPIRGQQGVFMVPGESLTAECHDLADHLRNVRALA